MMRKTSYSTSSYIYPVLNELRDIVNRFDTMLDASEEHKRVFKEKSLTAFRRALNLKDILAGIKVPKLETEESKGCLRCVKSCCQVYRFMSVGNSFRCNVSGREYTINSSFTCDSSGLVYVVDSKVCGEQFVGSPF